MILCKTTNLNSAFAVKIKALRGRSKGKAKARGNSFSEGWVLQVFDSLWPCWF